MRKGRSVYEQPGTKVDRVASCQKEGFQVSKGEQREVNGEWQGEQNRELRYKMCYELYMCI
jgi:hypothetical protein